MRVNLKIKNSKAVEDLIERTKKAIKELEDCVWEIRKIELDVVIEADEDI